MQDNTQNINELDAFSEKVKSKLENHGLALDADLWSAIQQGLIKKKRRRMPVWLWIPISSAAVIALLFTFRPTSENTNLISKSKPNPIQQTQIEPTKPLAQELRRPTKSNKVKPNLIDTQSKPAVNQSVFISNISSSSITARETETNSKVLGLTEKAEVRDSTVADVIMEKPDTVSKKQIASNRTDIWTINPESKPVIKEKYKNRWLLAASVGSGSNTSSGLDNLTPATLSNDIVKAGTSYTAIMAPENFTSIHYNLPLSFGLKVRDNFSKNLSLETGLVYTYLQTDFSNSGFVTTDARLGLHYLGIPLKLIVKLWNKKQWEVYVSGGGTVEKGLRSVYQQNQTSSFQTMVTPAETSITGIQLSLNSAAGVNYKINRNLGIFFEPNFSYYFNNDQPVSIRSKQPDVFSIELGVRYDLNPLKK